MAKQTENVLRIWALPRNKISRSPRLADDLHIQGFSPTLGTMVEWMMDPGFHICTNPKITIHFEDVESTNEAETQFMIVPLLWFWSILLHFAYMALVLLVISEVVVFVFSLCIWPYFILAGEGCSGNKQNVRNDTKPPTESKVTSHNWRRKDKNKVSAHNRLPVRKTVKLPQWWCLFQILESLSKQTTTTITTRRTKNKKNTKSKKNDKEEQ